MELFDRIGLDAGYVIIGLAGVSLILLILIVVLFAKNSKLRKRYDTFMKDSNGESLEKMFAKKFSDVEGLTEDMHVSFAFEPSRWHHAYFLDYAGQPHSTEIVKIYFDRNFETVALQFATKYERDGDTLRVAADNEKSNFLVIGAENKEEAILQYSRMLEEKR